MCASVCQCVPTNFRILPLFRCDELIPGNSSHLNKGKIRIFDKIPTNFRILPLVRCDELTPGNSSHLNKGKIRNFDDLIVYTSCLGAKPDLQEVASGSSSATAPTRGGKASVSGSNAPSGSWGGGGGMGRRCCLHFGLRIDSSGGRWRVDARRD